MQSSHFKTRLLTGFAVTAILFGAAGAQDKPNKFETQPKPQIVERDPFVNQISDSVVIPPIRTIRPGGLNPHYHEEPSLAPNDVPVESANQPTVLAPEVSVAGIVGTDGSRQAILRAGGDTRIVKEGEKLSDYRVSRISSKAVTFSYGNQDFRVELDSEF